MLKVAQNSDTGKAPRVLKSLPELALVSEDDRAVQWLDGLVASAKGAVVTQTIELSPSIARALLARNPDNRHVSDTNVSKFARDISNGAWRLNGEPIIVASDGSLNDGQHRCMAVVEAETSISVVLVVGTGRETRFTLDQGRTRSAGDYLSMNGHVDSLALAAVGSYVWQRAQRGSLSTQALHRPTKGEVLATISEHPDLVDSLSFVPKKGCDNVGGRSLLAFCHWTFKNAANGHAAGSFITALVTGVSLSARDPILYARNRLMAERGRLKANEKAELIFRAWNSHRRRETPKTLPILGGTLPAVEA